MNKGNKIFFLLLVVSAVFISCDRKRVFEENKVIPEGTWKVHEKFSFAVPIDDLISRYQVFINVRNAPEYPYSNLYVFLNTFIPDGKMSRDTIELTLADYDGRWLGSGMGSVKFSRFLLKNNVQFPEKGTYRFEIEQAMRVNDLKGIRDFGLRIEKQ